jgi:hypothetical protein
MRPSAVLRASPQLTVKQRREIAAVLDETEAALVECFRAMKPYAKVAIVGDYPPIKSALTIAAEKVLAALTKLRGEAP